VLKELAQVVLLEANAAVDIVVMEFAVQLLVVVMIMAILVLTVDSVVLG